MATDELLRRSCTPPTTQVDTGVAATAPPPHSMLQDQICMCYPQLSRAPDCYSRRSTQPLARQSASRSQMHQKKRFRAQSTQHERRPWGVRVRVHRQRQHKGTGQTQTERCATQRGCGPCAGAPSARRATALATLPARRAQPENVTTDSWCSLINWPGGRPCSYMTGESP